MGSQTQHAIANGLPSAFRLARYRFTLQALDPIELPHFAGSTLRGAFGGVFRKLVCVTGMPTCDGCLLRTQCAYGYMFETSPPAGSERLRNLNDIPRPFVIEPAGSDECRVASADSSPISHPSSNVPVDPVDPVKTHLSSGDLFAFNLVLVGRAIDYLPYFVFVLRELGLHGLGKGRGQYELRRVELVQSDEIAIPVYDSVDGRLRDAAAIAHPSPCPPACPEQSRRVAPSPRRISLTFLTPTRLEIGGRPLRDLEFHHLIRALLRRLSSLCYFHCGCELDVDFKALIAAAEGVRTVDNRLCWRDQMRYSSRQRAELQMGGVVGEVEYEGDVSAFLPLLAAGELVHVGKGCVMGMGRYQMEVTNGHR